ncbi:hypothetical protein ACVCAH_38005 [Micromonospora sp. LZ34]
MYHGGEQVDHAQELLARHTVSSADGRCLECGIPGPCLFRERAAAVFALSLRLPRRVPGATQPHLIGVGQSALRGWFAQMN